MMSKTGVKNDMAVGITNVNKDANGGMQKSREIEMDLPRIDASEFFYADIFSGDDFTHNSETMGARSPAPSPPTPDTKPGMSPPSIEPSLSWSATSTGTISRAQSPKMSHASFRFRQPLEVFVPKSMPAEYRVAVLRQNANDDDIGTELTIKRSVDSSQPKYELLSSGLHFTQKRMLASMNHYTIDAPKNECHVTGGFVSADEIADECKVQIQAVDVSTLPMSGDTSVFIPEDFLRRMAECSNNDFVFSTPVSSTLRIAASNQKPKPKLDVASFGHTIGPLLSLAMTPPIPRSFGPAPPTVCSSFRRQRVEIVSEVRVSEMSVVKLPNGIAFVHLDVTDFKHKPESESRYQPLVKEVLKRRSECGKMRAIATGGRQQHAIQFGDFLKDDWDLELFPDAYAAKSKHLTTIRMNDRRVIEAVEDTKQSPHGYVCAKEQIVRSSAVPLESYPSITGARLGFYAESSMRTAQL